MTWNTYTLDVELTVQHRATVQAESQEAAEREAILEALKHGEIIDSKTSLVRESMTKRLVYTYFPLDTPEATLQAAESPESGLYALIQNQRIFLHTSKEGLPLGWIGWREHPNGVEVEEGAPMPVPSDLEITTVPTAYTLFDELSPDISTLISDFKSQNRLIPNRDKDFFPRRSSDGSVLIGGVIVSKIGPA